MSPRFKIGHRSPAERTGPFVRSLRAVGSGLRAAWLILGITLLLILACEAGLRLALITRDRLLERPVTERRLLARKIDRLAQAEAYRDAPWVVQHFCCLRISDRNAELITIHE